MQQLFLQVCPFKSRKSGFFREGQTECNPSLETLVTRKNKNRRSKRRNKNKVNQNKVRLMGVNAAGISSKLHSLNNVIRKLSPSIFFIQETKLKRQGKLKIENPSKYIIYELNRKDRNGGGLAIGVVEELKPV